MTYRSDPTDMGTGMPLPPSAPLEPWTVGWLFSWLITIVVFVGVPLLFLGMFVWGFLHPPPPL